MVPRPPLRDRRCSTLSLNLCVYMCVCVWCVRIRASTCISTLHTRYTLKPRAIRDHSHALSLLFVPPSSPLSCLSILRWILSCTSFLFSRNSLHFSVSVFTCPTIFVTGYHRYIFSLSKDLSFPVPIASPLSHSHFFLLYIYIYSLFYNFYSSKFFFNFYICLSFDLTSCIFRFVSPYLLAVVYLDIQFSCTCQFLITVYYSHVPI